MSPMKNEAVADLVSNTLEELLDQVRGDRSGELADYIPQLAQVDPEGLALSVVSSTGRIYAVGDHDQHFTLQSASKPFVYALALSQRGPDVVHERVGYEPSGEPFNAISLDAEGRPANPMINAGAIVTSSLIEGATPDARFEAIRHCVSAFAGRELELDEAVYASETATGHRNRALANLALAAGTLDRTVIDATDVYFRQCSLKVTATDLAVMGATLSNNGVNPLTGVQVMTPEVVRRTLAIMLSCGMYNYSGYWMNDVGLPAKSGVGGGIVAVSPGKFGVGTYSPRLDPSGSSVRGVAALRLMSNQLGLHLLNHPSEAAASFNADDSSFDNLILRMRGELDFACVERIVHELSEHGDTIKSVHMDLGESTAVVPTARGMLKDLQEVLAHEDIPITIDDPRDFIETEPHLKAPEPHVADAHAPLPENQ
ncbi:glutaminase A [Stomatohabitans albus]|uniref:glutaminase A n=1 Tax=Stomatohabitans albus TaxID=3110766 RepID=UPI00300C2471